MAVTTGWEMFLDYSHKLLHDITSARDQVLKEWLNATYKEEVVPVWVKAEAPATKL